MTTYGYKALTTGSAKRSVKKKVIHGYGKKAWAC